MKAKIIFSACVGVFFFTAIGFSQAPGTFSAENDRERLKKNIQPLASSLEKVSNLDKGFERMNLIS